MTREEAIEMLKAMRNGLHETGKDFPYRDECIPYMKEACNMAIKALEQEPISETDIILSQEEYSELVSSEYDNGYTKGYREALEQEPCEDAVSRESVIELMNMLIDKSNAFDYYDIESETLEEISNLQPVTPARKKGKWIETKRPNGLIGFKCSRCGTFYPLPDGLNFCPNCGAEMESGE